jgi:hypothetical protein
MYKILQFIIKQLKIISMLKYALVENAMAADPNNCVAIVSSPESKNLDNVINYMIGEGTCLSRPANQRFKKGWLNRLADFRFFPTMVCILALMFCLSSCKSIHPAIIAIITGCFVLFRKC